MKIHRSCLPCISRQITDSSRMATDDNEQIDRIIYGTEKILQRYESYCCTPDIVSSVHKVICRITGNSDPYAQIKERDISASLALYPLLVKFLNDNGNDILYALKISATGNIIDAAINKDIDIRKILAEELDKPFAKNDIELFRKRLRNASTLLIIGDNSGETVFDKVLAECISVDIIYSVRSAPVLNDVTMHEALASGLGECTRIISSGCAAPGTILSRCSGEFLEIFRNADIVISKGQGNFEALSDSEREIFFLLKAKCPVVADEFGVKTGDYVFEAGKKG